MAETRRPVYPFLLFEVETHIANIKVLIKIEHLVGLKQRFLRQHRDNVKWNVVLLQKSDPGDYLVVCSLSGSRLAVQIVNGLRTVYTDTYSNIPAFEEISPLLGEKYTIGLHRVVELNGRRTDCADA